MDFQDLVRRTLKIHNAFPRRFDEKTQLINLMEEVGELSNAALVDLGDKPEKRRRAELKDSFSDVLFALIATADTFHIDLEKELVNTLSEIETRQEQKDYIDD